MFTIVDPTAIKDWDQQIKDLPGASFFHCSAWAKVLKKAYGYTPLYFVNTDRKLDTVIPLMEVSSLLTGKRAVSIPFTDYCELLAPHPEVSRVMFDVIGSEGKKRGWKYVELRSDAGFLNGERASASYYRHTLDLTPSVEKLVSGFRDSTRRNIRKAERSGVEVRFEKSLEALRSFYRLNCLTRREHGLPPQPWAFFAKVHKEIISEGAGVIALGLWDGKVVAANLYMYSNGKVIYKYGASDKTYQHLRANNLLMWEAIKHFAGGKCTQLCFGRTEPVNEGLRQFKSGWGTKEEIINYYRYYLAREVYMPVEQGALMAARSLFTRMPIPVSRVLGLLLYRHVG